MGLNQTLNSAVSSVVTGLSGGVTAGDLVSNVEGGYLIKVNPSLTVVQENNTTAGAAALRASAQFAPASYSGDNNYMRQHLAYLGNGTIANAYAGNGVSQGTNLNLRIRTVAGVDVVPPVTLSTDGSIGPISVLRISATQFVVAWQAGGPLRFMVLNNDGTTAVSATTVANLTITAGHGFNVAALANGQFVFAYDKVTSRDLCFSRYNASGVLQGSETTIAASETGNFIAVLGCTNGDFIVKWFRNTATNAHKFARYNSSGVIVGSIVTMVTTTNNLPNGPQDQSIIELSNGSIAIAIPSSADQHPDIVIYSSANSLLKTIDLGTSYSITSQLPGMCATPTGFAVVLQASNGALYVFDNAGNQVIQNTNIGVQNTGTSQSITGTRIFHISGLGYAIYNTTFTGTNYANYLWVRSLDGSSIGSVITLQGLNGAPPYDSTAILTPENIVACSWKDGPSNVTVDAYYIVGRRSIIGVAAETKAIGQPVRVLTNGTFTINQSFAAGGNFDQTAATIPGAKGSIVGNTAILRGTK